MTLPRATLVLAAFLASCNKDGGDTAPTFCPPVAMAGADQTLALGSSAALDGSESTFCGAGPLTYSWTFEQVPIDSALDDTAFGSTNGTLEAVAVEFQPDAVGSYVVSLSVIDTLNSLTSNADLVVINVTSDNLPPTADAGPDRSGQAGERIVFDGSASSDPEGEELTFEWTLASHPSASGLDSSDVYDPKTADASIVPDVAGTYVLSLIVSDGISWSEPDYVTVQVGAENQAPIADAGDSLTLPPCEDNEIALNGNGSYDPDGDSLTYLWSLTSAPSGSSTTDASFDDRTKASPSFSWDVIGSYTFSLQVYDGVEWSAIDIVTLTVVDVSANRAPVANAGSNQTIEATVECSSLSYVWTCPQCEEQRTYVDGTSSSDANGDALSFYWYQSGSPTGSGSITIESPYTAWSEVVTPVVDATYGTGQDHDWDVTLEVADCADDDTDIMTITVTCTGERP